MLTNPIEFDPIPSGSSWNGPVGEGTRGATPLTMSALPPEWRDEVNAQLQTGFDPDNADHQAVLRSVFNKYAIAQRAALGAQPTHTAFQAELANIRREAFAMNDEIEALGERRDALRGYDVKGQPVYALDEASRNQITLEIAAKVARAAGYEQEAVRRLRRAWERDFDTAQANREQAAFEADAMALARQQRLERRAAEIVQYGLDKLR